MKLYVGNLSYRTTEEELRQEFEAFGSVDSVSMITDRETGKPRGFAFVEMSSDSEASSAIAALNGKNLGQRTIVVNEAKPRTDNRSGGFGQRSSGGGNRGGGNFGNRSSGGGNRSGGYGNRDSGGYGSRDSGGYGSRDGGYGNRGGGFGNRDRRDRGGNRDRY